MTAEYAVVLVQSTSHVIPVEKLLRNEGISCKTIPVPRYISSDCDACIRIQYGAMDAVRRAVEAAGIEIENIRGDKKSQAAEAG